MLRHPIISTTLGLLAFLYFKFNWIGPACLVVGTVAVLVFWRFVWPYSFGKRVTYPARSSRRGMYYRRRWATVMTTVGFEVLYGNQELLPRIIKVRSASTYVDTIAVQLVAGQAPSDLAKKSEGLANGFGAMICRVRTAQPGQVLLELVRKDALSTIVPAIEMEELPDLNALPIGLCEDGQPWLVRLQGTHLLIAGATGSGKASLLWGLIRSMLPLARQGLVKMVAADPKLMELAYGRGIFEAYGQYAADPYRIAYMLEGAVADMQLRATGLAGKQRTHTPTKEQPFVVILIDEVAFLTCYQPNRELRSRTLGALATLTTQGRSVGYCVVAALQDPRKEVLEIRNLFPDRIALRLDESDQTDIVLGRGSRARGAMCEQISSIPHIGAGVAYVKLENDADPIRVRAGWVTDEDIREMVHEYPTRELELIDVKDAIASAPVWSAKQDYTEDIQRAVITGNWQVTRGIPQWEVEGVVKRIQEQADRLDIPLAIHARNGTVGFKHDESKELTWHD